MSKEMAVGQDQIAAIVKAWANAKELVVFTGAGMSTESGLPDFRSAQGLWKVRPESLATMAALQQQPDEFYFFYQWRIAKLWDAAPNQGHQALAALQQKGNMVIITQNVDGLHQRAGAENVVELHGSLRTVQCLHCYAEYDSRKLLPQYSGWEEDYQQGHYRYGDECLCAKCAGLLRPDVVLFGENLPDKAWEAAVKHSKNADFYVVLGSSLVVSPANYLPQLALQKGAKLLIINQEPTPLDSSAAWVINSSIGSVLSAIKAKIVS
ncbi:NAD-dependent deacylase [Sporomusa termitida]|uniref:protein acetyllysine N-acetyltransferase n=1 Tax=Sporomusa termitida TaxID=2377 RepID=A0A517DR01_9FIRM|nr:NAD-dependent deacylase [Sporomusa termitida]QDR79793.1 NAD-dependent protein deacetylase [Sporomusa termitida]